MNRCVMGPWLRRMVPFWTGRCRGEPDRLGEAIRTLLFGGDDGGLSGRTRTPARRCVGIGRTERGAVLARRLRMFQSPRHRGFVCRHAASRPRAHAHAVSIPSSSGIRLQGRAYRGDRLPRRRFQSPRHRGFVCRAATAPASGRDKQVSIPSSSGIRLQQRELREMPSNQRC